MTEGHAPTSDRTRQPSAATSGPGRPLLGEGRVIWLIALSVVVADVVLSIAVGWLARNDRDLDRVGGAVLPLTWLVGVLLLVPRRTRVVGQGLLRGAFLIVVLLLLVVPLAMLVLGT